MKRPEEEFSQEMSTVASSHGWSAFLPLGGKELDHECPRIEWEPASLSLRFFGRVIGALAPILQISKEPKSVSMPGRRSDSPNLARPLLTQEQQISYPEFSRQAGYFTRGSWNTSGS